MTRPPDHLLPFDQYRVHVPGGLPSDPGRWFEREDLGTAIAVARAYCQANRRRTTIHHRKLGLVAAVRPLGKSTVVIWYLHPKTQLVLSAAAWAVLIAGVFMWIFGLAALA